MASLPSASHGLHSADKFCTLTFDYLVIGGGNAGLPIAARLSENPDVIVGVLEAGTVVEDPVIDVPSLSMFDPHLFYLLIPPVSGNVGAAIGRPEFDYCLSTEPQLTASQRNIALARGKMLGGSTGINYTVWDRASSAEYDTLGRLLDPADQHEWCWDSLLPYLTKVEDASSISEAGDTFPGFSRSEEDVFRSGVPFEKSVGMKGAVKTSYNSLWADVTQPYIQGWNTLGVPTNANPYGGNKSGVYNLRRAIDIEKGKRVHASVAYFKPASHRKNLKVLLGAQAARLIFDTSASHEDIRVTGVEFIVDGKTFVANARKEVILSAGTVQTPQILELSGIGNAKFLEAHNIECIVDLPSVGENVTEHVFIPTQYLAKEGTKTFDEFRNNPQFLAEQTALYEATGRGWLAAADANACFNSIETVSRINGNETLKSAISALKEQIALETKNGTLSRVHQAQFDIQLELLEKKQTATLETFHMSKGIVAVEPGQSYLALFSGIQHPFSRGSIHTRFTDPLKPSIHDSLNPPILDPKLLSNNFDVALLLAGYRLMEKLVNTEPMKKIVQHQTLPPIILSKDEHVEAFIRQAAQPGLHIMGSAIMASRELGGVVDARLKVYGTRNLRIVDASIIPVPLACHVQATIYAIAEKAADMIIADKSV
ncbi:alcohol oxidase [Lentinula detonsa]|uniref:Alcohol oxidase n=1 Tax=Lentinula detonsa TaxID=2804962 RepID=A0AA38UQ48_9AGAR|nr:alcohol oxidase [Lentinula detonsa]